MVCSINKLRKDIHFLRYTQIYTFTWSLHYLIVDSVFIYVVILLTSETLAQAFVSRDSIEQVVCSIIIFNP